MTPELELLETEEAYVNSLSYIISAFLVPLEQWVSALNSEFEQGRSKGTVLYTVLKKESIDITAVVFSNIRLLLGINQYILCELQKAGTNTVEIVKKFSLVAPSLIMYIDYIRNCEKARELLQRLRTDQRFSDFIRAIEFQPSSKGLSLEQHLAKPWQRVMKYELLFREMKKRAEVEEQELLAYTIRTVQSVISGLNESQAASESRQLLMEKQKFYGIPELTGPARHFIIDGQLKQVTGPGRRKDYSFILCSDILIYGRKAGHVMQAKFKIIDVHELKVVIYPKGSSRYFILRISPEKAFQVDCTSVDICDEWVSALISVKTDAQVKHITGRKDVRRLSLASSPNPDRNSQSTPKPVVPAAVDVPTMTMKLWECNDYSSCDRVSNNPLCTQNVYQLPDMADYPDGIIPYESLVPVANLTLDNCDSSMDDSVRDSNLSIDDDDDTRVSLSSVSTVDLSDINGAHLSSHSQQTSTPQHEMGFVRRFLGQHSLKMFGERRRSSLGSGNESLADMPLVLSLTRQRSKTPPTLRRQSSTQARSITPPPPSPCHKRGNSLLRADLLMESLEQEGLCNADPVYPPRPSFIPPPPPQKRPLAGNIPPTSDVNSIPPSIKKKTLPRRHSEPLSELSQPIRATHATAPTKVRLIGLSSDEAR